MKVHAITYRNAGDHWEARLHYSGAEDVPDLRLTKKTLKEVHEKIAAAIRGGTVLDGGNSVSRRGGYRDLLVVEEER